MLQRKANTYRLYPTSEQRLMLFQIAGACRAVYNLALEQRRDWWQKHKARTGKTISFAGQCRELTDLRREVDWLREAPIHPLQQALRDLDRAYQGFFAGRGGYPSPRKKGKNDSFRFPDPASLKVERTGKKTGRIKLPKLGWVAFRGWYAIPGAIRNITISLRAGQWFASVQWEREVAEPARGWWKSLLPMPARPARPAVALIQPIASARHGLSARRADMKKMRTSMPRRTFYDGRIAR